MDIKPFLLILSVILVIPSAYAQISVVSHDINFELRQWEVLVEESIVFENPQTSDVHTFDGRVILLRGNMQELSISGMHSNVDNTSFPTVIELDFSKDPIFRSATENKKTITLTYITNDFTSVTFADDSRKINVFEGNIIIPLQYSLEVGETHVLIKPPEDNYFGTIIPQAEITADGAYYVLSKDDRSAFKEFFVEIQYADFKDYALSNIEVIRKSLEDARRDAEDADNVIINADIYDADTTKAQTDLRTSLVLVNESEIFLALAEALLEEEKYYQSFLYTNTSKELSEEASKLALSAEGEANLQLRLGINEKISQLENLSLSISPTHSPDIPYNETDENNTSETQNTTNPTVTTSPLDDLETRGEETERMKEKILAVLIVLFIAIAALVAKKRRGRKQRFGAVRDFRAISDLKRKSYKDFEKKVLDVKKETTIAGEIMSLRKKKKKYELGIENLSKRRISGEIGEDVYNGEKKRFDSHIKELDEKITGLEGELPKKSGLDEKDISDRPEGSR